MTVVEAPQTQHAVTLTLRPRDAVHGDDGAAGGHAHGHAHHAARVPTTHAEVEAEAEAEAEASRRVTWEPGVEDNEGLGKRSSKSTFCTAHAPGNQARHTRRAGHRWANVGAYLTSCTDRNSREG